MNEGQLMGDFESDSKQLEAESWSRTVDTKFLKQQKKDVVKRTVGLCRRTKGGRHRQERSAGENGGKDTMRPSVCPQVRGLICLEVQKRLGKKSPLCSGVLLVNGLSGGWRWGVYGALAPGG